MNASSKIHPGRETQFAIGVASITGLALVLSFSTGNQGMDVPALGRQEREKVCGMKTNVGREETDGQDSLGEIGVVLKFKRLAC